MIKEYEQLGLFDEEYPQYKIKKPIRLITLFSGVGSQEMAMKRLGVDFEIYRAVEIDEFAIRSYNSIHGTNFPTLDITKTHAADLEIVDRDKYEYIMFYSFPCLTADSLILTKNGYKQLNDVKVGDVVLTKSGEWHPVVKKFDNGIHETCYVNSFGFKKLHCTLNHKFWVREMYRTYKHLPNGKRENTRRFHNPEFKEVKDITKKDYFGIPVIQEEKSFYTDDFEFWYLLGFYIGDGWLSSTRNEIKLSCNDIKLEKLRNRLDVNKWNYTVNDMNLSCHKLRFMNKEVFEFIEKYIGTGSTEKRIPGEILLLPIPQLTAFFEGYVDSDGNINNCGKNDYVRITSVNQNLVYSISAIINKLYHRPASVNVEKPRKKPHFIGNREIKSNYPLYEVKFKYSADKQDKAFYEDGYIWFPFYNIEKEQNQHVYNIEVEDDHSYIVQGCISKNCTDLSLAGQQAGMSRESGTRSGLLWEVERILKECGDNLPQVLIMENVIQVHSEKNLPDFEEWINFLRSKGYSNFYGDLNAKDFGVPQNRDRCFMVSMLGKFEFKFPKTIPLEKVMADVLEPEVDEKYFITNEKADKLIEQLIKDGKIEE